MHEQRKGLERLMGILDSINDLLDGSPEKKLDNLRIKSAILDVQMEIEDKKRQLKEKQKP